MARLEKLRNYLRENGLSGIFVRGLSSIRYFTGFSGDDSLFYLDQEQAIIITDSRYTLQSAAEAPECLIIEQKDGLWEETGKINFQSKRLGFDGDYFTYREYQFLREQLNQIELFSVDLISLRTIKDEEELAFLRKAVEISDEAFASMLNKLHVGMREIEAAAILEYEMRRRGSEETAFTTIVASGKRSALPHGVATSKVIENGDFVTFDFGAVYSGYHSDITRTVVIGRAANWQKEIYDIVLDAQIIGIKNAKAGITGKELDTIVRDYISSCGYGQFFGHGLGHGVGLDIHELPTASKRGISPLETNMVVTVEPGIYMPGKGGVRIEDVIVIASDGCNVLTKASKQLFEIN